MPTNTIHKLKALKGTLDINDPGTAMLFEIIDAIVVSLRVADQGRDLANDAHALANQNWGSIQEMNQHQPLTYSRVAPEAGRNHHGDTWFQTDDEDVIVGIYTYDASLDEWKAKKFDKSSVIW